MGRDMQQASVAIFNLMELIDSCVFPNSHYSYDMDITSKYVVSTALTSYLGLSSRIQGSFHNNIKNRHNLVKQIIKMEAAHCKFRI